jgi:hypothetical protein
MPALFEHHQLDDATSAALTRYADHLKDWLPGILEWHRNCVRYRPDALAMRYRQRSTLPLAGRPTVPTRLDASRTAAW